jgi:hypothetical protein
MDPLLVDLRHMLATDSALLAERWIAEASRRCWHLRQQPDLSEELRDRCEGFLVSLAEVLADSPDLLLGAPRFREPLKRLSFVAGWLEGVDLPIGAGLALCHGLQAILHDISHPFFQNLQLAVAESYVVGQRQRASARHRQLMKKCQVVCMLNEAVAALILVGDPDREALEDAVGRLMMLALMRAAQTLLLDFSTVMNLDQVAPKAMDLLAGHREGLGGRAVKVLATGLSSRDSDALVSHTLPMPWHRFDTIQGALESLQSTDGAPTRPV